MTEPLEISRVYSLFLDAMKPLNERMRRDLLNLPSESGIHITAKNMLDEIGWLCDGEPFLSAAKDLTECFMRISYELFPKGDEATLEDVKFYARRLVAVMGPLVNEYGRLKRANFAQEISDGKSVMLVFLEPLFKAWLHFFDGLHELVMSLSEGKTTIKLALELRVGDPQPLIAWFERLKEAAQQAKRSQDLEARHRGEILLAAALGFLLGSWGS